MAHTVAGLDESTSGLRPIGTIVQDGQNPSGRKFKHATITTSREGTVKIAVDALDESTSRNAT